MDSTLLAAIVGALGGIIVAALGLAPLYRQIQKDKDVAEIDTINAEAMREIIGAAKTLYEIATKQAEEAHAREGVLAQRIKGLESDLSKTRSVLRKLVSLYSALWAGMLMLLDQLNSTEKKPVYTPPPEAHPDQVQKLLEIE